MIVFICTYINNSWVELLLLLLLLLLLFLNIYTLQFSVLDSNLDLY
jgi:hypothetical protein